MGAVLTALAYGAYRRRHSESAGDVMAVRWLRPVFRWGITVLSGTLGGLLLYELFWRSFQYSPTYEALPMTVCVAVAGIIGYYAASMLLAKSLRVFQGSWKSLLAVVVLSAAFCAALHFDVLGIESRMPSADQLQYVELPGGWQYLHPLSRPGRRPHPAGAGPAPGHRGGRGVYPGNGFRRALARGRRAMSATEIPCDWSMSCAPASRWSGSTL